MSALPEARFCTEAEYLAFERAAVEKHEYHRGEIVAMVGASMNHSAITANLTIALGTRLRGSHCRVFGNDLRVRAATGPDYVYPDVTVVCGEPRLADSHHDILLNPTLVIEVLSPSTESYDRAGKWEIYRTVDTLQVYLLVAQARPRIEQFRRQEGGLWLWQEAVGLDATLELPTLGCTVPLREIYDGMEWAGERA